MTNNPQEPTAQDDTAYQIALDCYHAGSMAQSGKTIHEGTVKEWSDRIEARERAAEDEILAALEIHAQVSSQIGVREFVSIFIAAKRQALQGKK